MEVYLMCLRLRTIICFSHILMTVEMALNWWFSSISSCTRESRKESVFVYLNCDHKHHPWRCSETVWKLGGFELIQKFNAYSNYHKRKSEWVLLDMLILIRHQWLIYIYKLGYVYAFKTFCWLHTFATRYCLPF